jgi:hypothetical protein
MVNAGVPVTAATMDREKVFVGEPTLTGVQRAYYASCRS